MMASRAWLVSLSFACMASTILAQPVFGAARSDALAASAMNDAQIDRGAQDDKPVPRETPLGSREGAIRLAARESPQGGRCQSWSDPRCATLDSAEFKACIADFLRALGLRNTTRYKKAEGLKAHQHCRPKFGIPNGCIRFGTPQC